MPIYEYECTSCHHQFDLMQKINDAPAKQCPHCFESTAVRLVSAAGFQLKGTGWYATDFKNKGVQDSKKTGSDNEAKPASEEKKGADSKPSTTSTKGEKD